VLHRTNTQSLVDEAVNGLAMNDIGVVELELTRPIFFDAYAENRGMGNFILIDPHTNATLAAGMIRRSVAETVQGPRYNPAIVFFKPRPGAESSNAIAALEQKLLRAEAEVVRTAITAEKTLRSLLALRLIVLVEGAPSQTTLHALSEFTTLDADRFSSSGELAALLLEPRKGSAA